jgi:putative ATP-binding cassette transporter
MNMIEQIAPASRIGRWLLLAAAAAAGIARVLALMLVNDSAAAPGEADWIDLLVFVALVLTSMRLARWTSYRLLRNIEESLHALKLRVVDKILATDLARFERIGGSEIFDRLGQNLSIFTLASAQTGSILQSLCVCVCSLVYLAWLSPAAFVLLLPLQVLGGLIYRSRQRVVEAMLQTWENTRLKFLDRLTDLLRGAKEIRLSRARARSVQDRFERSSAALRDLSVRVSLIWDDNLLFMSVNLYLIVAAVAFVLPVYIDLPAALVGKVVVAIMFSWGSLRSGLAGYSNYVEARSAIERVTELETKLGDTDDITDEPIDPWHGAPGRIEARGIEYEYPAPTGERPFHVGPLDLAIEPGELLFIVGGNGAGKSTLLKLLTGLYAPTRGALRVGDVNVAPENAAAYRETLSVIFSDFHLFARAYGLLEVDPARVRELLVASQLDHKTSFVNGRFTTRNLSTGQRKRLAMVVAQLEDRPVVVLDEWAADQDPEFRRHFYEELLPTFKRRGKTIIAVSHDDRYFHCADRVVVLDYGEIRAR